MLPCVCLDNIDSKLKRTFRASINKDPFCACFLNTCPFGIVDTYLSLIPDPDGRLSPTNEPLRFLRAKTTRGEIKFTRGPLGERSIAEINPFFNKLLPEELQLERCSKHSTRHTAASIAVNEGLDPILVAQMTKHKDPKMLKQYTKASTEIKLKPAQAIGSAVSNIKRVMDDEDGDGDEDEDKHESANDGFSVRAAKKIRFSEQQQIDNSSSSSSSGTASIFNFNFICSK